MIAKQGSGNKIKVDDKKKIHSTNDQAKDSIIAKEPLNSKRGPIAKPKSSVCNLSTKEDTPNSELQQSKEMETKATFVLRLCNCPPTTGKENVQLVSQLLLNRKDQKAEKCHQAAQNPRPPKLQKSQPEIFIAEEREATLLLR